MADDNSPLNEDDLQRKLAEYQAAIKAEFETNVAENPNAKEVAEVTLDYFRKNLSQAAAQIVWLSQNSTSDAVRFQASKYIHMAATKEEAESGDPVKALIAKLQSNDNKPQPAHE